MHPKPHIKVRIASIIPVLFALMLFPTLLRAQLSEADMAQNLNDARSFQRYPTYEHYLAMMSGYARDYPEICLLDTFGTTPGGRQLLALKISDRAAENETQARFLYTATMHGDELLGYPLLLRLADTLLRGYGTDLEISALVNDIEIWINPLANPDASFMAGNHSLVDAQRFTPGRTDLNRDFPAPAAGDKNDTTGRALETRYMMEFMNRELFSMSANIHGGEEVVNYPWDYDSSIRHVDDVWFRFVSGEYADEAMAVDPTYMFGWPEGGITNGAQWYITNGNRQDYATYYLGGREVTLELSNDKMLLSKELERYWKINYRSLLNYMQQCRYGIRGRVVDSASRRPLEALVEVLDHDKAWTTIHSRKEKGDFYRLIAEGSYDLVVSSAGYISDTLHNVQVYNYQATLLEVELSSQNSSTEETTKSEARLWPNPGNEKLFLLPGNLPHGALHLSIHSTDGRLLGTHVLNWQGETLELSTSQLDEGLYLLHFRTGRHAETRLFIIQ